MFLPFQSFLLTSLFTAAATCAAVPIDIRSVRSVLDSRVSLSFKEVCGSTTTPAYIPCKVLPEDANLHAAKTHICETTPGVKSYSGYVNLPANPAEGRNYDVHTFFWFFEARKNPSKAPLSLWLQGGPGVPSIQAALGENGPCFVNDDSSGTRLNPWSWNNEVNMLYIDQPVQTGFSYDRLINGTIDETVLPYLVKPVSPSTPPLNSTHILGVFPSQNATSTANTTATAALAAWHFMQVWMKEFVSPHFLNSLRTSGAWFDIVLCIELTVQPTSKIPQVQAKGSQVQHLERVLRRPLRTDLLRLLHEPEPKDRQRCHRRPRHTPQSRHGGHRQRVHRHPDPDALLSRVRVQQHIRRQGHQRDRVPRQGRCVSRVSR